MKKRKTPSAIVPAGNEIYRVRSQPYEDADFTVRARNFRHAAVIAFEAAKEDTEFPMLRCRVTLMCQPENGMTGYIYLTNTERVYARKDGKIVEVKTQPVS